VLALSTRQGHHQQQLHASGQDHAPRARLDGLERLLIRAAAWFLSGMSASAIPADQRATVRQPSP
jgi:hypothetical protein